jgi:two-component system chemotaxis response regulator CheY
MEDAMKIMIVDDSSAMRMIVRKTLRLAGFEGHEFSETDDGQKALTAIKASAPDLVLSDWNMPNMTGIELLEALTTDGIKVKFGFITTEATPDMRQRAAAAGASFLISKPFSAESFKEILGVHIK